MMGLCKMYKMMSVESSCSKGKFEKEIKGIELARNLCALLLTSA